MIKIFEDLYDLCDGTFLKWNTFSRSWKIVSNCSFDILTQDLPDVDFEKLKKNKKNNRVNEKQKHS